MSNCYLDVYLETANQAIKCCEICALLTDRTSSTEALQKKSVPSGLVVLHAAALAAWSWRWCIIYEIIIRSVMMISNSLVVLDSGQMFWNQRCSERRAQWPNFYAEVSLPCRLSRLTRWLWWASPRKCLGTLTLLPLCSPLLTPRVLHLNVTWKVPSQGESLLPGGTGHWQKPVILFLTERFNNPTHLLQTQYQKHDPFLTFKCDLSLKPQCTLLLTWYWLWHF